MANTSVAPAALAPLYFQFQQFPITVILRDDEPWFVASEILPALGLHRTAVRRLDDDEKGVHKTHTLGGEQEITIISEPGLYRLIGRSNKPAAKAFNRWACHEVFPAIRKTGSYAEPNSPSGFITAAQAGELSALIAGRFPDGRDRPYAWGRFNNHFRIARYRELPAERFAEACAYIGAMPTHPKALPAPNLSALPAEALAAARKLALDYFDAIQAGEKNPRVGEIPEEVLTGIVANMLMNNRWLVSFDPFSGRMNTLRIDPSAFMVTAEQLPGFIREPLNIPAKTLFDIQAACHERIRNKFGAMEEARFIANAK